MAAFLAASLGMVAVWSWKSVCVHSGWDPDWPPSERPDTAKLIRVHEPGNTKGQRTMRHIRISRQRKQNAPRYTHLSAFVSQEDGCFTVQIRLYDEAMPKKGIWGEEIADSIETASALLDALAEAYSIPQDRIKIRVQMDNTREGTRH